MIPPRLRNAARFSPPQIQMSLLWGALLLLLVLTSRLELPIWGLLLLAEVPTALFFFANLFNKHRQVPGSGS